MSTSMIPDDIRRFIMARIPSVPYLEALLLLRSDPAKTWSADRLTRSLYVSEATAMALVEALLANGVITQAESASLFRYHPASEDLGRIFDMLAALYGAHLVEVTHLIHARTSRKAQRFADAFVWRKDSP